MSNDLLLAELAPILAFLPSLDLSAPEQARAKLAERFPLHGPLCTKLHELFAGGSREGWLCDREGGGARFSRVAKAGDPVNGYSIDAVELAGPGVWHRHTRGEIDLCFTKEGSPRFDGHAEGWVVFAPGSEHVPTVAGGAMQILYFLPGGALEWKRA